MFHWSTRTHICTLLPPRTLMPPRSDPIWTWVWTAPASMLTPRRPTARVDLSEQNDFVEYVEKYPHRHSSSSSSSTEQPHAVIYTKRMYSLKWKKKNYLSSGKKKKQKKSKLIFASCVHTAICVYQAYNVSGCTRLYETSLQRKVQDQLANLRHKIQDNTRKRRSS